MVFVSSILLTGMCAVVLITGGKVGLGTRLGASLDCLDDNWNHRLPWGILASASASGLPPNDGKRATASGLASNDAIGLVPRP